MRRFFVTLAVLLSLCAIAIYWPELQERTQPDRIVGIMLLPKTQTVLAGHQPIICPMGIMPNGKMRLINDYARKPECFWYYISLPASRQEPVTKDGLPMVRVPDFTVRMEYTP